MKNRRQPRPATPGAPVRARPGRKSAGRTLVVVDQEPLRRGAAKECNAAMAKLEKARAEWQRFQQEDQPAFERWMAATFGAILTEMREVEAKLREKTLLVREVEMEFLFYGGRSFHVAYQRVMERRNAPPPPPPTSDRPGDHAHDSGRTPEDDAFDEFVDDFELEMLFEDYVFEELGMDPDRLSDRRYEQLFQEFKKKVQRQRRRAEEPRQAPPPEPAPAPAAAPKSESARIKEIYRILVRRLHPDSRSDENSAVSSLWHEVQEAYAQGNLERMETLLALTDLQANTVGEQTSLFQIREVLRELRSAFQAVQRSLSQAKKQPAWNFSRLTDRRALETKFRRNLERDRDAQQDHLAEVEALIASWERKPAKKGKSPKATRPQSQWAGDEWF